MTHVWFESVAEAERRAQRHLPRTVFLAIRGGAERGLTLDGNTAAFGELGFLPRIGDLAAVREQGTTVMGQEVSLPVLISPAGVQAVHPDGEIAVARAAAARGTALGLSSFGSKPLEDVVAANPKTFFQVYWSGSRELIEGRLERARAAGAAGLIVTLDWTFSHARDWGSPKIPEHNDLRTVIRYTPEAVRRPGWTFAWLRAGGLPPLTVPNAVPSGQRAPTFFEAYGEWYMTPPPSWDDLRWLRAQWDGPFMVKGVLHPDDARRAVDIGATALSVSNHGGTSPATIRVLPAVASAVGDQIEVLLDGGIRRGGDVVKALALGARAVMVGRPYLFGLAAGGQAGVENVLDVFRNGIDSSLLGLGRASIHELRPSDVLVPPGFACTPPAHT